MKNIIASYCYICKREIGDELSAMNEFNRCAVCHKLICRKCRSNKTKTVLSLLKLTKPICINCGKKS